VNGVKSKDLPQRAMTDDEGKAIGVFKDIMRKLQAQNNDDSSKCWEWPKAWPKEWGDEPPTFTISRNGQYGQFALSRIRDKAKPKTIDAHILSYKHFNIMHNPSLWSKAFALSGSTIISFTKDGMSKRTDLEAWMLEFETAAQDFAVKPKSNEVEQDDDDESKVIGRVVRHGDNCPTFCVNPDHLRIGSPALNALDRDLKQYADKPIPANADNKRLPILADFDNGDFNAQSIGKRHGVAQWIVVRIVVEAGRSNWFVLLHDFNAMDNDDHKPKDMP
jgi:hypothetical protein